MSEHNAKWLQRIKLNIDQNIQALSPVIKLNIC